jgi:RNA polymerase sigma factor (sigma-70 family)
MNADLRALLQKIDWDLTTRKLLAYGSYRVTKFGGAPSLRQTIQDYVQEAIERLFDGTRQFQGDEEALFRFLCGVVDSLMSHDLEKARRRGKHLSLAYSRSEEETQGEIREDRLASSDDLEGDAVLRNRFDAFLSSLDDRRLKKYALMRAADDGATTEEHAEALCTSVEDVRNMDRRLRRRRAQW